MFKMLKLTHTFVKSSYSDDSIKKTTLTNVMLVHELAHKQSHMSMIQEHLDICTHFYD
jgi:hypothetical protein